MPFAKSKDNSSIYYEIEGQSNPVLCFVYGLGGVMEHWMLQRSLSGYTKIYVDLPGHGKSISNRKEFTMEKFGEDISAVIQHAHVSNVILVGWSMGGMVILEAAKLLPDKVIGIIGIETFFPYFPLYQGNDEQKAEKGIEGWKDDTNSKVRDMYEDIYNNQGQKVMTEIQEELRNVEFPPDHVVLSELKNLMIYDVRPLLSELKVPIKAIISGDVEEKDRPSFKEYNIDAVFIEGHGHGLHMTATDEVHQYIHKFVGDITGF